MEKNDGGPDFYKTLRDEFAMAALTGLLADPRLVGMTYATYAGEAYTYADAMLEARNG